MLGGVEPFVDYLAAAPLAHEDLVPHDRLALVTGHVESPFAERGLAFFVEPLSVQGGAVERGKACEKGAEVRVLSVFAGSRRVVAFLKDAGVIIERVEGSEDLSLAGHGVEFFDKFWE